MQSRADLFSVVICTLGTDWPALSDCLNSISRQTRDRLEIILVSRRSIPDSLRKLTTRTIIESRKGLSIARNIGVRESSGSIIAFTDDDCVCSPSWAERLSSQFSDPSLWLATGRSIPLGVSIPTAITRNLMRTSYTFKGDYIPYWEIGNGNNMAIRRAALEAIGPFDEDFGAGASFKSGEDTDMFLRVLLAGGTIVYEPSVVISHRTFSYKDWLKRECYSYRVGEGALYRKFESMPFSPTTRNVFLRQSYDLWGVFAKSFVRLHIRSAGEMILSLIGLNLGFGMYSKHVQRKMKVRQLVTKGI